ncbi:MAG TPA: hypothetical protein PKD83_04630 [Ignavibacteria bacterium]|nr:hypothetical protein [Ignavibacteria bacterium]
MKRIIENLLNSKEPSIRYKVRVNVYGEDPDSKKIIELREEIRNSPRVKKLFKNRDRSGRINSVNNIYDKWQGAHWILSTLADIGYPAKDETLFPVRDEILDFWLKDYFFREFEADSVKEINKNKSSGVPKVQGRYRRCASQQGNALFFLLKLEIGDERVHKLAERLLYWQWPDGGWNCDKNPSASNSSFIHTIWSLRGLGIYNTIYNDKKVDNAVKRAAEVLLKRKLFKRITTGEIIRDEFTSLHYPLYWHYDILGGLKVMAETGIIKDNRCNEALDLLESKLIPEEGWPAEKSYFKVSDKPGPCNDYADWGKATKKIMNEWVTADALFVLKKSGRLKL